MFEAYRPGDILGSSIEARLDFGGRNVADGFEQASVIGPVHPFQSGGLGRCRAAFGVSYAPCE